MRFILSCCCALAALPVCAADLKLTLHSEALAGKVLHVALYAGPDGFPDRTPLRSMVARADGDSTELRFSGLAPGTYAVSAFADANGNGLLDRNFVGKPVEPYGFSRDARRLFGPPAYADAAFRLGDSTETALSIHLH